ncbi:uncharacterized protein DUF2846 [Luteibacter rhizovicinus]|uniref:Uncharacterized protein DUF2846 n=1 Tax=Luteibacter rhizovicinus TaxID=242606 RepID=A0A4R3YY29_9GAMM|nr:DUF2846 domain-containing protein [Luteibacter rhizovicinus]TCV96384.1 uncharacterized protein DUF2846 [Luteibacter rhizovicinus]
MIHKYIAAAIVAVVLVVSGCASVPMANKGADAEAKQFAPIADKATVYIYRDEIMGAAIKMHLLVDGAAVGDTAAKTYVQIFLSPGQHVITSKAENDTTLSVDVQAGRSYYVWQEVKMGILYARSALHLVDESKGQTAVRKCDLVRPADPSLHASPSIARVPAPEAMQSVTDNSQSPTPIIDTPVSAGATAPATGGPASLDPRVTVPMFNAAQDVAAVHQCDRMIRVESIEGEHARFFTSCPSTTARLDIECNGNRCIDVN